MPEREIVELLGHEGKLARTTRIYAKYDPARLANTMRALILDQGIFSILPYPTVRPDVDAGLLGAARIVKPPFVRNGRVLVD